MSSKNTTTTPDKGTTPNSPITNPINPPNTNTTITSITDKTQPTVLDTIVNALSPTLAPAATPTAPIPPPAPKTFFEKLFSTTPTPATTPTQPPQPQSFLDKLFPSPPPPPPRREPTIWETLTGTTPPPPPVQPKNQTFWEQLLSPTPQQQQTRPTLPPNSSFLDNLFLGTPQPQVRPTAATVIQGKANPLSDWMNTFFDAKSAQNSIHPGGQPLPAQGYYFHPQYGYYYSPALSIDYNQQYLQNGKNPAIKGALDTVNASFGVEGGAYGSGLPMGNGGFYHAMYSGSVGEHQKKVEMLRELHEGLIRREKELEEERKKKPVRVEEGEAKEAVIEGPVKGDLDGRERELRILREWYEEQQRVLLYVQQQQLQENVMRGMMGQWNAPAVSTRSGKGMKLARCC